MLDGLDTKFDIFKLLLGLIGIIGLMEFFANCPDWVFFIFDNLLK